MHFDIRHTDQLETIATNPDARTNDSASTRQRASGYIETSAEFVRRLDATPSNELTADEVRLVERVYAAYG